MQTVINEYVNSIESDLIAIRRDFHQYPELGWHEIRTASLIAEELAKSDIEFKPRLPMALVL